MILQRGQRVKLADICSSNILTINLSINAPSLDIDYSSFSLNANNTLVSDDYMTFYNQSKTPCGGINLTENLAEVDASFAIDLNKISDQVKKISIAATIDGNGTMSEILNGQLKINDRQKVVAIFDFSGSEFNSERALILMDIYHKDNFWRVNALGQGFNEGLATLVKHFGGEIEENIEKNNQYQSSSELENNTNTTEQNQSKVEISSNLRGVRVCVRCNKKIGVVGRFLGYQGYHISTGRCSKCEGKVKSELNNLRKIFAKYIRKGILSKKDWDELKNLANIANINWSEVLIFIQKDILSFLERKLDFYASNGIITDKEEQEFIDLYKLMELPYTAIMPLLDRLSYLKAKSELNSLRKTFTKYIEKGILSKKDWDELKNLANIANIKWSEFLSFIQKDILSFLESKLAFYASDGIITDEEEQEFIDLYKLMELPYTVVMPLLSRLSYLKDITKIRKGDLTVISTNAHLESDELCYLETVAAYQKVTTKEVVSIQGRLLASNKKLHFLSNNGGWSIQWKNIMQVTQESSFVLLELSTKQGNGRYKVEDSFMVEAILTALTKIAKRQLLCPTEDTQTRRIPSDVKIAVWQRDQGRCVECNSTSYLEFDHIIPFSKGGANTVNNIQLLCRRCNLAKGDRI